MKLRNLLITASALTACLMTAEAERIVILSDVHVTPGNVNETKLTEAVAEINSIKGVDLVVVNGDLTNQGADDELKNVKKILDRITLPLSVLPGNHENNWSQSATKTFNDLWGNDRFVSETDGLVIVGINCGPYMKMGDGHIKQEDLHWLRKTLDERAKPGKRVVSFNHYPLNADIDNWTDYAATLQPYPVIAHINGHYHKYDRYNAGDIDCMMTRSLATGKNRDNFGYAIMDITPDSVIILDKCLGQPAVRKEAWATRTRHETVNREPLPVPQPKGMRVEKVWTDSASIFTRVAIDENNFYFGNSLGYICSIDKHRGTMRWSHPTGASLFSRPVTNGEMVAVPATTKEIIAFDSADGTMYGALNAPGPYVADGILKDGALYQGGYKCFVKFDAEDAIPLWRFDSIGNYCQAEPVIDGDDVIFGAWDTNLYCLDSSTGALKWKWNNGKYNNLFSPGNVVPVVTHDKVVIVAPDRFMTALDRKTGEQLWRDNSHKYRESLGHSEDHRLAYAKTMDGELVAVDITSPSFKEEWIVDLGLGYDHAPCIVLEKDGRIYTGSRRGIVTVVDSATHRILASLRLGNSEVNGFDVDPETGDVYTSLIEGTIWRLSPDK